MGCLGSAMQDEQDEHCYREAELIYLISFTSDLDASLSTDSAICILYF